MKFKKSLLFNILLATVAAVLIFLASKGEVLHRVELFSSDVFFRLRKAPPTESPIIIVEVTDQDVVKIGRWPWKRSWHAAMTKVLYDLGAAAIYFDIIFSEPSSEQDDLLFEEAIKISKKVYLPYVFQERPYNVKNTLLPIERFSSHVKGMGAMNVYPDEDGTIRILPLLFIGETGTFPHVALRIAMDYLDLGIGKITPRYLSLKKDQRELVIPFVGQNSLVINWRGKWIESFKHYSFIDVLAAYQDQLEGKTPGIDLEDFKGAICLVGVTSFGLYDIKPIPLEPEYPGIGIIANTLSTLLEGRFIRVPPEWINICLIFLMAMIPSLLIFGENPFRETMLVFLIGIIYLAAAFLLFTRGTKIDVFFPVLGLFVSYITVETYNFVRTTVEKQRFFSRSITDALTGLFNISYFKMLLDNEIKMARSGASPGFALVLTDIDNFKHFNDTYGHLVGDLVLKEVANTLKASIRASDIVARYGGEEMMILLKHVALEGGLEVAEKIRKNVESHQISDEKNTYSVTASFGVAAYLPDDTVDVIIKRTDEGLYRGKEEGRNCVRTIQETEGSST